ncbi:ribosomal-protein-alanine N-acetyltransferase [Pullulanibacillus pueri]|uniref:N-acetyltransferase n=1 Tax=Pullulanibacillus pueri TaxID=1437324 RepID=A0A8J3EPE4_9BACL|nr:GNAT family N-acetyltransferase [Pullulanibacillus pueri]MBM7684035.1 ribosomal-protein-alanine N-acetyltransferase [Pullulanibacillus pueri]GGH88501.1 N-acetyltransferase [Pullulanibacillus pueri]
MDEHDLEIPVIETERYRLRGLTLEDTNAIFPFMSNKETMKYITPHPVKTEQELRAQLQGYVEAYKKRKLIPWVIIDKSNLAIIGVFRFHKLNLWHKKAEMGVVIHKDYQRSGVMTEVLMEILAYGFNDLGLNRIVGDIFADNQGSKRLLMKYGFKMEGRLRETDFDGVHYHDTEVYALLKSEYHPPF